jgi:cathepsin L
MLSHFDYLSFMAQFGRQITDVQEFKMRLENFTFMHNFIEEHNASGKSWVAGHNQFSDWSHAEYKAMLGHTGETPNGEKHVYEITGDESPVDWIAKGAVNAVQDQGQCGSCWAFSATFAEEGAHFLASGSLEKFAEQQLVDCAGLRYGNLGCNGGMQDRAFNYLEKNAFNLETAYPYVSGTTKAKGSCAATADGNVKVLNYKDNTPNSVAQLKAALATAPQYSTIEADKAVFQTYKSGIFDSEECGTQLDHATGLTGWGTEDGVEYWVMRNSWGTTWGDQGYMKIKITGDGPGICGILMGTGSPTSN